MQKDTVESATLDTVKRISCDWPGCNSDALFRVSGALEINQGSDRYMRQVGNLCDSHKRKVVEIAQQ
jgi:hypothetical protein